MDFTVVTVSDSLRYVSSDDGMNPRFSESDFLSPVDLIIS